MVDRIEAGFEAVRIKQRLRSRLSDIGDVNYWRQLNPQLSITDNPFAHPNQRTIAPELLERTTAQMLAEGYLQTPPLLSEEEMEPLRTAIQRLVKAGLPAVLILVYDEFYRIFQGMEALVRPFIGEDYVVTGGYGFYAFYVPVGDAGVGLWSSGMRPHRDLPGVDAVLLETKVPSLIEVWIPLVDVSTLESCMYLVPAPYDPEYYSDDRRVLDERIRLQDIRALPAPAGSILMWTTHAIHWGSRSSPFARHARIALAGGFQSVHAPTPHPDAWGFHQPLSFEQRLRWIEAALHQPGLLRS